MPSGRKVPFTSWAFNKDCRPVSHSSSPEAMWPLPSSTWLRPNPPAEADNFWKENYPGMQSVQGNLDSVRAAGYREIAHFVLPTSSWREPYYTPQAARIAMLRDKYRDDDEAIQLLNESQKEIDLYRQYSDWYGYVFYIMQAAKA